MSAKIPHIRFWNTLFVVVAIFIPLAFSNAVDYGGLGGRPAHPDPNDPRTSNWFVYTLAPGSTKTDEVMIVNNTGETKTVELYPADSTPSSEGGFALKQKVEPMNAVGSWIQINEPGPFTIGSNETKNVPFTVTVPANPEPGEQTGGIMIQEVKPVAPDQGGIALSLRMGVRVYITIPGEIVSNVQFLPIRTTTDWDKTTIHIPIQSTGNVSTDGVLDINVYSALTGQKVASFNDINVQILRESTFFWHAEWLRNWHGGLYKIDANLTYKGDIGSKTIFTTPITIWLWPTWPTMAVIGIILLLILVWIFMGKRRKKGRTQGNGKGERKSKKATKKLITSKKRKKT